MKRRIRTLLAINTGCAALLLMLWIAMLVTGKNIALEYLFCGLLLLECVAGLLLWCKVRQVDQDATAFSCKIAPGPAEPGTSFFLTSEILNRESMILALQSQINPHFLYNTLETIRGKALSSNAEEVADMIEVLARMLRYNISRRADYATLRDEIENVRDLVAIQNYRFRGRFSLFEDFEQMDTSQYILPILTLQPLVENAIHHGLEPKIGQGMIILRIFTTESKLMIQIRDNGVGMTEEQLAHVKSQLTLDKGIPKQKSHRTDSSGIALINVYQRIRLFFGDNYGLNIISAKNVGTTIELVLPKTSLPKELN